MNDPENKTPKRYRPPRERTGEDIDMLNEYRSDPQAGPYGSTKYKDDIDGA